MSSDVRIDLDLAQAQRRRRGEELARRNIDSLVDELVRRVDLAGSSAVKNYQMVGPDKRKKLKGLIDFYRKKPHPFTACVTDNTKRFGAEGAKKVCAVLTDLEKNTTKWRNGGNHRSGLSLEQQFETVQTMLLDQDLYELLMRIADTDYKAALGLEKETTA